MSPFLEGVLAGYGIAVPVGAIAVLIIGAALQCGMRTGFMAGAGAATADLLYAALASLAGVAISRMLAPWALPLRLLGGAVLIVLAVRALWRGSQASPALEDAPGVCPPGRMYLQFLGLTIINPMTVIYFGALILGRDPTVTVTAGDQALFVLGAGLASLSWQTILAMLGALARRGLSSRFRRMAVLAGNIIVLALGVRIIVLALLSAT